MSVYRRRVSEARVLVSGTSTADGGGVARSRSTRPGARQASAQLCFPQVPPRHRLSALHTRGLPSPSVSVVVQMSLSPKEAGGLC